MDLKQRIESLQSKLNAWTAAHPGEALAEVECISAELIIGDTALDMGGLQNMQIAKECFAHATKVAFQIGVRHSIGGTAPGSS